jgi:hypothetical protein
VRVRVCRNSAGTDNESVVGVGVGVGVGVAEIHGDGGSARATSARDR